MRKILTNNNAMLVTVGFLIVIGVGISVWQDNFLWLARFGSTVTCVGIIIISRPGITRKSLLPSVIVDTKSGWISILLTQAEACAYRGLTKFVDICSDVR